MISETETITTVPAIAVEALAERYARLVRCLVLGWVTSLLGLVAVAAWML